MPFFIDLPMHNKSRVESLSLYLCVNLTPAATMPA